MKYILSTLLFFFSLQSVAQTCDSIFESHAVLLRSTQQKLDFVQLVASRSELSRLQALSENLRGDEFVKTTAEYLLKSVKFKNNMPHYKVEMLAQRILQLQQPGDGFFNGLLQIVKKPSEQKLKESLQLRLESIILAEDIASSLKGYGVKTKKTSLTSLRYYVSRSGNIIFGLLGFTEPDFTSFSRFDRKSIKLVREQGFEAAYPQLKQKFKLRFKGLKVVDGMSRVLTTSVLVGTLVISSYMGLEFTKGAYGVGSTLYSATQLKGNLDFSETRYLVSTVHTEHPLFKGWSRYVFYEIKGRQPGLIHYEQDRIMWSEYLTQLSADWKAEALITTNKIPDLKNDPEARKAWQDFVNTYKG